MDKKQKKFLIIGIVGVILAIVIICAVSFSVKKEDGSTSVGSKTNKEESQFNWPDLTEYNIPNLEFGKVANIVDNGGSAKLDYVIDLESIKKSDIEKYSEKFDSDWTVSQNEATFIMLKSKATKKYSVFITCDEEKSTAKIVISSL